jgi:hypothetical protein
MEESEPAFLSNVLNQTHNYLTSLVELKSVFFNISNISSLETPFS